MQELVLNPTQISQWHALVGEAQHSLACKLDEELESYLVFLLIRFTNKPEMANRVLAIDYLESLQRYGKTRLNGLKDVGDQCLLFSGLFPQQARQRRVKVSYYVDLGRSAYRELSDQATDTNLFNALAQRFVLLMDILQTIRSLNRPQAILEPQHAYELWQETGSQHALRALQQRDGIIPANHGNKGTTTKH